MRGEGRDGQGVHKLQSNDSDATLVDEMAPRPSAMFDPRAPSPEPSPGPLSRLTSPDRLHCALHASRLPHAHTLALRCAVFRAFVRAPSLHPVRRTCRSSPFHRAALLSLAVLPLRRATRPCSVPSRTHSTIPSTETEAQSYMSVCLAFISSPPLCALGRSSILPK